MCSATGLLTTQTTDVKEGTTQVKIPVGKDWGSGAYVVATLRRPALDCRGLSACPARAIGLKWFGIDKKTRTLQVTLSPPAAGAPQHYVEDAGQSSAASTRARDAKIVVAAVDVGILKPHQLQTAGAG